MLSAHLKGTARGDYRHRSRLCKLNSSLFLLTEILILRWIQTCPGWTFWRRQLIIISINLWSFWKSAEEQTHDSFIFNKALMKSEARRPAARLYKETSLGIVLWRCHCHFGRSFRNTPLWKRRALQHKYRYFIALEKSIVFVSEKPWFIPWPGKILIGLLQLTITCWRASSLLFPHWDIKTKANQASLVQVSLF